MAAESAAAPRFCRAGRFLIDVTRVLAVVDGGADESVFRGMPADGYVVHLDGGSRLYLEADEADDLFAYLVSQGLVSGETPATPPPP